jgi:hypothetical protein
MNGATKRESESNLTIKIKIHQSKFSFLNKFKLSKCTHSFNWPNVKIEKEIKPYKRALF